MYVDQLLIRREKWAGKAFQDSKGEAEAGGCSLEFTARAAHASSGITLEKKNILESENRKLKPIQVKPSLYKN